MFFASPPSISLPFFRLMRQLTFQSVPAWMLLAIVFTVATTTKMHAQNFTVNSTADRVDREPGDKLCDTGQKVNGVAECTLRAAVDEVNGLAKANPGTAYKVLVPAGTYYLTVVETCPYYDVGNPNQLSRNGITLCISGNLTLTGADPATTIVDGGLIDRMFFVSDGVTAAINNMTIQHGTMAVPGSFDGSGGGVNNQGTLTLANDVFTENNDNNPSGGGGAVYNGGTLVVEGCSFLNNANSALAAHYATTSINLSYFSGNTSNQGAAVETFVGTLNISNSTFVNNTVDENAIIGAYNTVATITNSTISNNTIQNTGTIVSDGNGSSVTLNNDTVYGNTARTGEANSQAGLVASNASIANTILAGNSATDCTVVSLVNYGHNIIQNADFVSLCRGGQNATTLTGVDPKLGPLTFHGGIYPTQTPLPGSSAIGKGSDVTPGSNTVSACTALDQRGFVRGASGACTIGAVEADLGSQTPTILPSSHGASGTITAVIYGGGFDTGSTVTFQLAGKPALVPTQTSVDGSTKAITVTLSLTGAAVGAYDVVVTTAGGQTVSLPAAFTVEAPAAPDLYGYAIGPEAARAGRPAFYSFIYGNRGNVDAYLVPLTISIPGGYAGLISSPVLAPPAANGQALNDFTYVPVEVAPYSTTGYTNVPLIVPVIPAGSQGVLMFSITPPAGLHGASTYSYDVNLGDPYGQGNDGSASAPAVADLVSGAQTFAETYLGVKLSAQDLAQMNAYATAQLAQELNEGKEALLQSAQGEPIFFSIPQLSTDIAAYGASLANGGSATALPRQLARAHRPKPLDGSPDAGTALPPCHKGQVMEPGTSCDANATPAPTPDPKAPRDGTISKQACGDMPNHHVSADGERCIPINPKGCGFFHDIFYSDPFCGTYPIATAIDPNEKDGQLGFGTAHFTVAGDSSGYQIEFENEATANAAAQTVTVTDQLDTSKLDLSTFQLGPISFGKYLLTPSPGLKNYTFALDLRPDANVIVSIKAGLNSSTGVASWSFTSLDPATMKFTTDPLAGFLPPDTAPPAGIGHVAFTVKPLASLATGTQICNTASIVFDTNDPIPTAPFCNQKDVAAPVSAVQPLSATQATTSFTVSWSGTDAGSGVAGYYIYVSDNGGPFTLWQTSTALNAVYTGTLGHTYGFFSDGADNLGNTEVKTVADTTTTVGTAPAPKAALNPTSLDFGNVTAGTSAAAKTVTLSNAGNAALTISSITLTGPNASAFTIASNSCGAALAAGVMCNISISFFPATAGTDTASLTVVDAVGTQTTSLTGTGTAVPAPKAALSPASANFGGVTSGTTSSAQTFTLKNAGNAPLPITSISLSGANPSAFAISVNACGSSLAAGNSCTISVSFTPKATGSLAANLTVIDTVGTQIASLSGTGTAPPAAQAALTPSSASFGSVTVGMTASGKVFALANSGNAALTINSATLGGANASAFAISANTCGTSLAPAASCSITTTFTPTAVGDFAATLSIVDAVGTQTASLTGSATATPAPADFTVTATPATRTTTAGGTVTYNVTVAPTSAEPFPGAVTLSATGAPAGSKITFSSGTVTPGSTSATSTLTVVVPHAFARNNSPSQPGSGYGGIITAGLLFPIAFMSLLFGRSTRRHFGMIVVLCSVLLGLGASVIGCGGHSSTKSATTSTISITGASGSTSHTTTVTVIVQ